MLKPEFALVLIISGDYFAGKVQELREISDKIQNTYIWQLESQLPKEIMQLGTSASVPVQAFYSTNAILLEGLLPELQHIHSNRIIEPFAGHGDLINACKWHGDVLCYDIDPIVKDLNNPDKAIMAEVRDTLLDPPEYSNAIIITNPPYLARNKALDKTIFDIYDENDLYKCFLRSVLKQNVCAGGLLIIPLNFLCTVRAHDVKLRGEFLSKYKIRRLNIYNSPTFEDTDYTVISFVFQYAGEKLLGRQ